MKKVIMMVAVAMMAITTVNAQSHGWLWMGAKAGLTSTVTEVQLDSEGIQTAIDGAAGYNAGLMFRFNVPLGIFSLHLQPELMYNWQKGQLDNLTSVTLNSFSVPMLAGAGLDLGLFNARVQLGPVMKFNSNVIIAGENAVDFADADFSDTSYSWTAGVGIDLFNFIMVDFRYNCGWNEGCEPQNMGDLFNFENINKEPNSWSVSLGIMF